jgi:hypothetical protein
LIELILDEYKNIQNPENDPLENDVGDLAIELSRYGGLSQQWKVLMVQL